MINIQMELSFGSYRGEFMHLSLIANGDQILGCEGSSLKKSVDFNIVLPGRVLIETSGKNVNDTMLDSDGRIIEDKYIRVDAVYLNNIPVEHWILEQRLFVFQGRDGFFAKTNYFGSNGLAILDLPQTDIFDFWLDLQIDQ